MRRFSPYAILQEHAARQPEAEAIVSEDGTITYGEFLERVTACANWLLHNGLMPGEITGICIRGDIEHIVCAMALLCLGTPQMCLASRENGATKQVLVRKVGVTQLVVDRTEEWMGGLRTIAAPSHDSTAISTALNMRQSGIIRQLEWRLRRHVPKHFGLDQSAKDLRAHLGAPSGPCGTVCRR